MKIQIEATEHITKIQGVPVRLWRGVTESGSECHVFVHRIAVPEGQDSSEFEAELREKLPPGQVIDLRLIL